MNNQNNTDTPSTKQSSAKSLPRPFKYKKPFLAVFILLVIVAVGIGGYFAWPRFLKKEVEKPSQKEPEKIYQPTTALTAKFADYEEVNVNIDPQVASYSVDRDLANITNKDDFTFSKAAEDLLAANAFVVIPADHREFYSLYESNRYSQLPSFITTDSMLHNYHLMFDHILKELEEEKLIPELKFLNRNMLGLAIEQYNAFKGTEWENAAKRNIGFFTVGSELLDSGASVSPVIKNEVEQELALIKAHQGIDASPVMNIGADTDIVIDTPQGPQPLEALKEDYSQYIPRGHYDKTEDLKAYFKSMMWYGRLTFRLKNEDEIKSALLIVYTLNQEDNCRSWDKLYEPINFFVGKSDDLSYYQFKDLLDQIYGQSADLQTISEDKEKFASFVESAKKLEAPQINSIPIFEASLQPDREEEIKGFRFMGQRFTIDASIFQRLLYREVGDKTKSCLDYDPQQASCLAGARCLPKGLDIPAAMGSEAALDILEEEGESQYACYSENMNRLKNYLASLGTDIWTQNLYWGWLYSLLPLTTEKTEGFPSFMSNLAWLRKELNTYLGSWTELKHDTILYAKQAYAERGASGFEPKDDRGYVEPNPAVYSRLASLLKMTTEGLENRGLLGEKNKADLGRMEQLALSLKTISEKELNNVSLTKEEYDLIKSYGGQLEHFWYEVFSDGDARPILDDETDAPLVADVATDPNGQVLEEGTGYISEIYVVVPIEDSLRIAKGGVYSYYEFSWPMADRLTDGKWQELLNSENAPSLPVWTNVFTTSVSP